MTHRRFALANRLAAKGLPPPDGTTLDVLRDVVDEGVLGASNHVALVLPLIARIAGAGADAETGWRAADVTADFIAETRGAGAPIVANALAWQRAGIAELPVAERAGALAERAERWASEARARRTVLVQKASEALGACRAPLVFDYSSTVADIVTALAGRGLDRIVIPESRAIDGGRRYIEAFRGLGVALHVLPDAAAEFAVSLADTLMLGAESVTADGGVVNTIGSLPHARAARAARVRVYGAADLFKVGRVAAADWPAPALRRYDFLDGEGLVTEAPELELVAPEWIDAVLTERGPLTPEALAEVAAGWREAGR